MGARSKDSKKGKRMKPATEWRQCNDCGIIVYFKDEQCHLEECSAIKLKNSDSRACSSPLTTIKFISVPENLELHHCYYDSGILHAKVSDTYIKDLDWNCVPELKNLILMHPSAMKLCKISANRYVTVVGNGYKAIHVAWPCHYLDFRSVDFGPPKRIFHFHRGSKVAIQSYSSCVQEAGEITFVPMEADVETEFLYSEEFSNVVSYQLYSELLTVGMTVTCKYQGSSVKLTVARISSAEPCSFDANQSLNENMKNLTIQDNSDSLENFININESYSDSLYNQSTDSSFNLSKSDLYNKSVLLSSTPKLSTKTVCLSPSFNENFTSFGSCQKDRIVHDVSEEVYFKVTESSVITVQKNGYDISVEKTTFNNIGGLKDELHIINTSIKRLFSQKNIARTDARRYEGILLHGPPGTGKTLVAQAIEAECRLPFINVTANEVIIRHYGSEEKEVQKRFEEAIENAPCVICLDQIDKLCCWKQDVIEKRGRRVLATLVHMFDKLKKNLENPVLVVATAHDSASVHPTLRTCDRFNVEIEFKIPSPMERNEILQKLLNHYRHTLTCEEVSDISSKAHAFTGSDLDVLCRSAISLAILKCMKNGIRDRKEMEKILSIDFLDVTNAMKKVTPFSMMNQEVKIEKVSWDDICGMYEVKKRLQQAVEWPLKYPDVFSRYNINPTSGILMHGPPGCSKTMLAKALASESGLNFIPVKGPELFNKFYGESERSVRELFARARASKPCIIFLDEVDALLAGRESSSDGSDVGRKVVCQFLSEFGGIGACDGIIVIAATNRPDILDEAVLRPGRIGELIEVPLPDADTRKEILQKKLQQMPVSDDIDFELLVERTKGFSGAQVVAACKEAAWLLVEDFIESSRITMPIILQAIEVIRKPDVTFDDYD